jgi:large-conductance mechanosensitive channel
MAMRMRVYGTGPAGGAIHAPTTTEPRRARGEAADGDTPAPSDEAVLLTEIRDLLSTRQ